MKKTITITIDTDSTDVVVNTPQEGVNTPNEVDDDGYYKPTLKGLIRGYLNFLVDLDRQRALRGKVKPFSELDSFGKAARYIRLWDDAIENSLRKD